MYIKRMSTHKGHQKNTPNYYEAMSLYEYVQKKDEYRQQKLNKTEW